METNVSGLNAWTADGEEDEDRQSLREETRKNKADTQRERGKQILFLYQRNLKGKELEHDSGDLADHP